MTLEEIMTHDIVVCSQTDPICSATKKMKENNIGFLPVCDKNKIVGVLTDRDIVVYCITEQNIKNTIASCMTKHLVTIEKSQSIMDALEQMKNHKVKRLLVTEDNKVVGVISLADLYPHIQNSDFLLDCLQQINTISHNKPKEDVEIDAFYL